MACLHASRTASTDSGLAFMVATTVTGMGNGLLDEYVRDGCLAYLRDFRIGQPTSTHTVMLSIATATMASPIVSAADIRVGSVPRMRSSRAMRKSGNVTLK